MDEKPRRRWFRFAFSLRMLFVVVTMLASALGWLVWEMQIVRERKAIVTELERIRDLGGPCCYECEASAFGSANEHCRVSSWRRFLGDTTFVRITFPSLVSRELIERVERAFPEAELVTDDGNFRDSLDLPRDQRVPNVGTVFNTGLIETSPGSQDKP